MSNSITQDMKYRQSLMKYAEKYGVTRASRKYNKGRSYIYFWRSRWDGTVESLGCQSRRPHSHPRQHTEEELKLIRNMRRRNRKLGCLHVGRDAALPNAGALDNPFVGCLNHLRQLTVCQTLFRQITAG